MCSEQWQFLPHLDLSPGLLLDCYPWKQLGTKLSGVIKDAAGRVGWFGERFDACGMAAVVWQRFSCSGSVSQFSSICFYHPLGPCAFDF